MAAAESTESRRKSGSAVLEAREAYRLGFKASPFGVVFQDAEGAILAANPAAERILGLSLDQMKGLRSIDPRWRSIRRDGSPFPGEEHPAMVALRTGRAVEDTIMGVFNGSTEAFRWLHVSAVPFFREGRTHRVMTSFVDVTDRLRAEEALRESEELFRTLFEASPDALFIRLADGPFLEANAAAVARYGYTRDEFRAMSPEDLVPPRLRKRVPERVREALASGLPWEWIHRRKDGTEVPVELVLRPVTLQGRACIYARARDLTQELEAGEATRAVEIKLETAVGNTSEAMEELRRSEEEFRTLAELIPQIVWITRRDGLITYFNQRWMDYTGLTLAESSGDAWSRPFHPEDRPRAVEAWREATTGGGAYAIESRLRRHDGIYRWWLIRGVPIRGKDGEVTRWFGTCTDIDDMKQAEEQRARLQAQLTQSQKMESLGVLAGGLAHDINNVLAAILAIAGANEAGAPEGSQLQSDMATIATACQRGGNLARGLIQFARQRLAEERDLDLNRLVQEGTALLARTTLQKVRVDLDLDPALRPVKGDPAALGHALINLCVNAVEAMPEGGSLRIRTRNDAAHAVLEVQDTGAGMPRDVLARALDPFFTTKPQGRGTGLGLPMVYGAVKAHRGELEIRSEPGAGTTVRIRIPACGTGPASGAPAAPAPIQTGARPLGVLLVDDDELVQTALKLLLRALNHTVTAASGGAEALALLEGGLAVDLIILDMNMPDMDGAQALPLLRALRPRTPVLLATGRADEAVLALVAGHAGVRLLPKPFSMEELRQALATT